MKKCNCGYENDDTAKFCKKCGSFLPEIQTCTVAPITNDNKETNPVTGNISKRTLMAVIAVAVVVILGLLAFMMLGSGKSDYYVAESGVTDNGWEWTKTVSKDGSYVKYDAYAIDLFTADIGNGKFTAELYYKDGTKDLSTLFADTGEYPSELFVSATANGNSGDGYVTVWRVYYSEDNQNLGIRYVSNSPNNMGTLITTYHVSW